MTTKEVKVDFVEVNDFIVKKRETVDDFKYQDLKNLKTHQESQLMIVVFNGQSKVLKNRTFPI